MSAVRAVRLLGTNPVKRLLDSVSDCRTVNALIVDGMLPLSRLLDKLTLVNVPFSLPIKLGIEPLSRLCDKSKLRTAVHAAMVLGMVPVRLFNDRFKVDTPENALIVVGMLPTREFTARLTDLNT